MLYATQTRNKNVNKKISNYFLKLFKGNCSYSQLVQPPNTSVATDSSCASMLIVLRQVINVQFNYKSFLRLMVLSKNFLIVVIIVESYVFALSMIFTFFNINKNIKNEEERNRSTRDKGTVANP